jgi:hypothetical protein
VSTENSTKPPQDNATCGDIEKRIEDYTATIDGTAQDKKDFAKSLVGEAIETKGFTESAIEACIKSREASPAFVATWKLPSVYKGPKPTWIRRTTTAPGGRPVMDTSGYKIFLGGLWRRFHPREIMEWLKSDCHGEDLKAVPYVKDIHVVPPSQNQRSNDCKASTLRNLMEGCT